MSTAILVKLYDPDDKEVYFLYQPKKKGARKNGKDNSHSRKATGKEPQRALRLFRAATSCADYLRHEVRSWFGKA